MKDKTKHAFLLLSVFFLISISFLPFSTVVHSAMPAYQRLQPVTEGLEDPTAVAVGPDERIYVTESGHNRLSIYSPGGNLITRLKGLLSAPLGVAVDLNGRIFVGNGGKGNVEVYNADLDLVFKLGSGDGEFIKPCGVAADSSGKIYVADCGENKVKVYNPDGSHDFSFGSTGDGNGQFRFPTSVAIDQLNGEIIVADQPLYSSFSGSYQDSRLQVFNMAGQYQDKKEFDRSGGWFNPAATGPGMIVKPMGVAIDEAGGVYVSDAYQNVVEVFDGNSSPYGSYLGAVYDNDTPLRTPLGIAYSSNSSRLLIASNNASRVDIYCLNICISFSALPESLTFQAEAGGTDPALQNVNINNDGTGSLNWTASADSSWITVSVPAGVTSPSSVSSLDIGVTLTGLSAGTYSGSVEIVATDTGATEVIEVVLTVSPPPAPLSVTPSSLIFLSEGGITPPSQILRITAPDRKKGKWSALPEDSGWLTIDEDESEGKIPGDLLVSVDPTAMGDGMYVGYITVNGEGESINVRITMYVGFSKGIINVNTDLEDAAFTINGPESHTGGGMSWSVQETLAGLYTILYGDVGGYVTPASDTQVLGAGGSITFNAAYEPEAVLPVSGRIIAGAGPGKKNPAIVKVFSADGIYTLTEFTANSYMFGVNVAGGDIDGDGVFDIITGAGPGEENPAEVGLFDITGTPILSAVVYPYNYGVNVASADIDGDGNYEVITGTGPEKGNLPEVKVYIYDSAGPSLLDSGIDFLAYDPDDIKYGVRVAAGDVDGDGNPEIITAPGFDNGSEGIVRIWKVDTSSGTGQWSTSLYKEFTAVYRHKYSITIAGGDINGDGTDEIITGAGPDDDALDEVKVYDEDGQLILEFTAEATDRHDRYGVNVASCDLYGDGASEIIAGAGPGRKITGNIKVFDSNGDEITAFEALDTRYGANIACGGPGE